MKVLFHNVLAFAGCFLLLSQLVDWHGRQTSATTATPSGQRLLTAAGNHKDVPTNFTSDKICDSYMQQFLNGTTDAKDVCTAMQNAYTAAGCLQEENIFSVTDNVNATDDALIDDFFENYECCTSISEYYEVDCQEGGLDAMRLFGIVLVLVVCGLMKSLLRIWGLPWIPDAGVCILVGALVGGMLRLVRPLAVSQYMTFDNDLFLQILLPPIIFEAAISIDKKAFRRDLFPILTFAIGGTAMSAVGIGLITHHLSAWSGGHTIPLLDSLIFGALMSSIDPVATLSILSNVGVRQSDTLYTMVFGESLLNDGVSIVLFDSLIRHMGDKDVVDKATVKDTLVHFAVISVGSIAVGLLCGTLCNFYFWALQGQHTAVAEVALFFTWANLPFYLADALGLSGIISIMVMGFTMDMYVIGGAQQEQPEGYAEYAAMPGGPLSTATSPSTLRGWVKWAWAKAFSSKGHVTEESRQHVKFVAEVIASLMETAIFAYLGLFLFNDKDASVGLMGTGVFACVSSRAGMVVILCALINVGVFFNLERNLGQMWSSWRGRSSTFLTMDDIGSMPSNKYLDPKTQFILFTAGVRGAVSYALVQNIPVYDAVTKHGSHFKGELRAMTSVTIVGLLFVFGALTYFAVDGTPTPLHYSAANGLTDSLVSPSNEYAPPGSGHFGGVEHELHLNQMDTEFEESQPVGPSMQRFG
jgi:NhaP-type Na+/H+ or K+/H+ antiporter